MVYFEFCTSGPRTTSLCSVPLKTCWHNDLDKQGLMACKLPLWYTRFVWQKANFIEKKTHKILSRLTDQAPNSGTVECCVVTVAWLWSIRSPFDILQSKACITRLPLWFVCLSNQYNHRTALIQSLQSSKLRWTIISWERTALLLASVKLTQVSKSLPLEMLTLPSQDQPLASKSGSFRTCCLQLWGKGRRWTRRTLWTAKRSRAFQMCMRSSVRYLR